MLLVSDSCHYCIIVETVRETLRLGSGGPQPSGSKKDLFLISELKQRCGRLWICTAETIKEPYEYGR